MKNEIPDGISFFGVVLQRFLYSSGSQVIHHSKPKLGSFIFSYINSKNILLSIGIDSKYNIAGFVYYVSAIAYLVMNRIEIDDWIGG